MESRSACATWGPLESGSACATWGSLESRSACATWCSPLCSIKFIGVPYIVLLSRKALLIVSGILDIVLRVDSWLTGALNAAW